MSGSETRGVQNLIDFTPLPRFELRVTTDLPGCVRIEAVRPNGAVAQELFCTIEQARALIPALTDLPM